MRAFFFLLSAAIHQNYRKEKLFAQKKIKSIIIIISKSRMEQKETLHNDFRIESL